MHKQTFSIKIKVLTLAMFIVEKLFLIALISVPGVLCESAPSSGSMEMDSQCGGYCYSVMKPLLLSAATAEAKVRELTAKIQHLESELELSKSKQKYCLTRDDLMAFQQLLVDKLQDAMKLKSQDQDQASSTLENKGSEIARLKSESFSANETAEITLPSSCVGKENGIYEVKVPGSSPFQVSCDSSLVDADWTVIQRRLDGSVDFKRNMHDYRSGFGHLDGEFFIGLDKLYLLTKSQPHELYIYMMDVKNKTIYGRYENFSISGKEDNYRLNSLGKYEGNVHDGLSHHLHWEFSTYDNDHDIFPNYNCALLAQCGWWFSSCFDSLNAIYDTTKKGIQWRNWNYPLKFVQMMIRPKQ